MALGNLSSAISAANTGRSLAQQNASIIANNVANVNTSGYSRKELGASTMIMNGIGSGVQSEGLRRDTDMFQVEHVRSMTAEINRLEILNTYYSDFIMQFGQPGENNTLTASINDLKKSFETLSLRPESAGARSALIFSAQNLAQQLTTIADTTQKYRSMADKQIYTCVGQANQYLDVLLDINNQMQHMNALNMPTADILDRRDETLKNLTQLMNINVDYIDNGMVNVYTDTGQVLLLHEVVPLSFSMTSGMCATTTYATGTVNPVYMQTNPPTDMTSMITNGRIGSLLQIRDVEFVNFQENLDQLTGVLRDTINAIHNQGTSSALPQSLAGTATGNTLATAITGSGTVRIAVVDRATGNLIENTDIDLSSIGSVGSIIAQIGTTANATASLDANGALHIQSSNASYGISIASVSNPMATITSGANQYGFSHFFGLNDFFITGSTNKGAAAGIANQLKVNPNLTSNNAMIANTTLKLTGLPGTNVISSGGSETLLALTQSMSHQANFAAAGKLPALTTSIMDYCTTTMYMASEQGRQFNQLFEEESTVYELTVNTLDAIRGVNVQEEMINLMMWQQMQKICTQVIMTAEEMMNNLSQIGRR